jgi:hypothetical protein
VIEVENRTMIAASPLRVWTALASLGDYGRWHPFIRLSGEPATGAKIGYTFTPVGMKRMMTTSATITYFDESARIGWRAGFRGLMTTEELYELLPVSIGTELMHRSTHSGLLAPLKSEHRRKRLLDAAVEADVALERYLRQPAQAAKAVTRRSPSRGQRHPFREKKR